MTHRVWRARRGKKGAQAHHAKRRAGERYALRLSDNDLLQIARMIQRGEASFVERQSLRVTVWDVLWQGVSVRVAYDTERHSLVTFLPMT